MKGSLGARFGRQAVPSAGDHKEASHRVPHSGLRGLWVSSLSIILSHITFDGSVDFYFILRKKKKIFQDRAKTLVVIRLKAVKNGRYKNEVFNQPNLNKIKRRRRRRRTNDETLTNPTVGTFA